MKNNMNALAGIGSSAAVAVSVAGPFTYLAVSGFNALAAGFLSAAVGVVLAALLLPRLMAFADKQYGGGLEVS
jgi:hypothetical protein